MPGNALALLAIAVGATVQLTASSGPFNLWSSMVGLLLLAAIVAYRNEIGHGGWTRAALSLISGYVLLFTVGFAIDALTAPRTGSATAEPLCRFFPYQIQVEGVLRCPVEQRDLLMFIAWLVLSGVALAVDLVLFKPTRQISG